MSRRVWWVLALVAGVAVTAPRAMAQINATTEVEFPEAFGLLTSVRELPDGRLLVADPLGQILAALDMDAGTMDMWGREGGGPQEYRQPDAVFALPGDSTLLVDLGNGRLTVIDPQGVFTRTRSIALSSSGPQGPGSLTLALPRTVDGEGRIYFPLRSFQNPSDSSAIGRVGPDSDEVERLATFKPQEIERSGSGGNIQIRQVPMSPQDDWAVGADGTIALVRSDGYYLEIIHPDGRVSIGPKVGHRPIRPGEAEKQAYLDAQAAAGLTISVSIGGGGQRQMQFGRGGQGGGPGIDDYDWPNRMPAFRAGSTRIDPEGRVWVGRTTKAGEPSLFDVFDGEGQPIGQVKLDPNSSIVGFGRDGAVYTTRTDDVGLQWLQRRRVS